MNWWQRWKLKRAMHAYFKADAMYDKARAFLPEHQRSANRTLCALLESVETKRRDVLGLLGAKP